MTPLAPKATSVVIPSFVTMAAADGETVAIHPSTLSDASFGGASRNQTHGVPTSTAGPRQQTRALRPAHLPLGRLVHCDHWRVEEQGRPRLGRLLVGRDLQPAGGDRAD